MDFNTEHVFPFFQSFIHLPDLLFSYFISKNVIIYSYLRSLNSNKIVFDGCFSRAGRVLGAHFACDGHLLHYEVLKIVKAGGVQYLFRVWNCEGDYEGSHCLPARTDGGLACRCLNALFSVHCRASL